MTSPDQILIDSSVLIDYQRNRNNRRVLLHALVQEGVLLSTSTINLAEVLSGVRPSEQKIVDELFSILICLPVNESIARAAGTLRNAASRTGRTLHLPDVIVAATALEHNLPLATDNHRDFAPTGVQFYPLP